MVVFVESQPAASIFNVSVEEGGKTPKLTGLLDWGDGLGAPDMRPRRPEASTHRVNLTRPKCYSKVCRLAEARLLQRSALP